MEMTQKQIEIEAQNYLNSLDLPENADKQLILDNFKNGMTWMMMLLKEDKQQWIEKAAKWFREHAEDFIDDEGGTIMPYIEDECFVVFKKTMEEEL